VIYSEPLKPCPFCGNASERDIWLQTPVQENDGRHHRAYFLCFVCKAQGPTVAINCSRDEIGELPVAPIVAAWNLRIQELKWRAAQTGGAA
jgi:hypothetical protein